MYQPKSAGLARRGEFYHALLMHLGHINEGNLIQALDKAWDNACRLYASPTGQKKVLADMCGFLNREDVRPFFYLPVEAQVFCEKEFVNGYGDVKRIDRLIVLESEVWVVDFKLSPGAQDEHQKQVDGYVELVRQFYPDHKVSGHILYLTKV